MGRYGTFLERGEQRATIPAEIAPDELTIERALELIQAPNDDRVLGQDPATGLPVIARAGRFGPYVQVGEAGAAKTKPRTASLFAQHEPRDGDAGGCPQAAVAAPPDRQ